MAVLAAWPKGVEELVNDPTRTSGRHSTFSEWPNDVNHFNWELHVISGIASERATDDIEDLEWQKDPVLTVYIGGDIDLDKIEIPEGVTLRAAPGQSEEAKQNEAAKKKIEEFVKQR